MKCLSKFLSLEGNAYCVVSHSYEIPLGIYHIAIGYKIHKELSRSIIMDKIIIIACQ